MIECKIEEPRIEIKLPFCRKSSTIEKLLYKTREQLDDLENRNCRNIL
jgi:hypothetical protein